MPSQQPPQPGGSGDELFWRETYFILFDRARRPTAAQVQEALRKADGRLVLRNLESDEAGQFASVLIESPEDHAAVEASYAAGAAVVEQNREWAQQLKKQAGPRQLQRLLAADARLEVAHFERIAAAAGGSDDRRDGGEAPGGKRAGRGAGSGSFGEGRQGLPRARAGFGDFRDDDFDDDFEGDSHGEDDAADDFGDDPFEAEGDELEMLDPSCLLIVVETLAALTRGVAFDPAAGEIW